MLRGYSRDPNAILEIETGKKDEREGKEAYSPVFYTDKAEIPARPSEQQQLLDGYVVTRKVSKGGDLTGLEECSEPYTGYY